MEFKLVYDTWFVPPRSTAWVFWKWMFFKHTKDQVSDRLFRHELQHCYQIKKMGRFRFYLLYVLLAMKYGYWKHPYEVEAREFQNNALTPAEQRWRDRGVIKLGD